MTVAPHIPGFEDEELLLGEDLTDEPAFWLAHLLLVPGHDVEEPEAYGVAREAYDAMVERLFDAEAPTLLLRVPFRQGHTACVVYQNFEDESDTDFLVHHPDWGRLGFLGQFGPHGSGPGLSWPELVNLARSEGDPGADGLRDQAQRFLLLLPALGDADTPLEEARRTVAEALAAVGFRPDVVVEFAAQLLGEPERKPRWFLTPDSPIPVCSSHYSPRQIPLALGITEEQARTLAEALSGH
ncbi:hypothetical protein ACIG5E_36900 [Kitasatospora sp. NPDC053057]|uniref:hypothetical protein n=1 Tax=Kitasatospora sp. NPDC053057 TaxID=3364062 RepID=UPI0037CBE018